MIPQDKLYIHMPFSRLLENLDEFCSFGVNCEIYIDANVLDVLAQRHIEAINAAFDKYNLKRSIHSPFMDLNPASSDKDIGQVSINKFKRCIDLCTKLKAKKMVMHTHFHPVFYDSHRQQWLENAIQPWKELAAYAGEREVVIAVENSIDTSAWAALELLSKIEGIKACFDIAHYNVFSPSGWKTELLKYPPDSIAEVHLSDNRSRNDEHLALGEGNIDFKRFFAILHKQNMHPDITLEPHDKEGILKGLDYIKKL